MSRCCPSTLSISIKFKNKEVYEEFNNISVGDWVDLRVNDTITIKNGEFKIIDLGVAMKLPDGYEAIISPRSSTFKKYGLIQTNSIGVVDNSYQGDEDWWGFPVLATRDITLLKGTRVCQFRVQKNQPKLVFKTVDTLNTDSRGGFGSTGEN